MDIELPFSESLSVRPSSKLLIWDSKTLLSRLNASGIRMSLRTLERKLKSGILPSPIMVEDIKDEFDSSPNALIVKSWHQEARRKRSVSLVFQKVKKSRGDLLMVNDGRGAKKWALFKGEAKAKDVIVFFSKPLRHLWERACYLA